MRTPAEEEGSNGGRVVPLRVGMDATPLLGRPTGVGAFCAGALGGLGALAETGDLEISAFAVSWRRRHGIDRLVPAKVSTGSRPMPARPLQRAWRRTRFPPIEWFVGPIDVVHGTNFVVPPTRRAARVVTVHDLTTVRFPELCDPPTLLYPALLRRAVADGAFVHTPSRFVAAEVVEMLGADPVRVRAVHSGVPPLPAPDPEAPDRFLPAGCRGYLLSVGTAEPRKDLPGLVAAFGEIAGDHPDLALVLAGPDGWGSADLAAAIDASGYPDRIVRTGWVDDPTLSGLLHRAEILAYPSVYEGFGFPPLQAMAAGVPVVATRAGALEEVLGSGAVLVPPKDPSALAEALAALLDSPDRRLAAVAAGAERAARFTWDRCARGLADLYRTAAAKGA